MCDPGWAACGSFSALFGDEDEGLCESLILRVNNAGINEALTKIGKKKGEVKRDFTFRFYWTK